MTEAFDRRKLLKAAVFGGTASLVGATAMGSLAPEEVHAAAAAKQSGTPGEANPNFAEGRVTGRKGSLLQVAGSDGRQHKIRLTGGTSVWKLHPTTIDKVNVGDGLYARGVPMPDGEFAAEAVWVNIVNLAVHVSAIGKGVMQFQHNGSRIVGHVVPGTTAAVLNGTPAISDLSMLTVGQHAQVVGAWRPDTNEIDIATIYARAA
jgi:hypothetical protein